MAIEHIHVRDDELSYHALIWAILGMTEEEKNKLKDNKPGPMKMSAELLINGQPASFSLIVSTMWDRLNELAERKAVKIVEEKAKTLTNTFYELTKISMDVEKDLLEKLKDIGFDVKSWRST